MQKKDINANKKASTSIHLVLLFVVTSIFFIENVMGQTPTSNIQKFENSVFDKLNNEVIYKGYDFEGFSICVKINSKGLIDTTLISLAAMPELRDRIIKIAPTFNYKALKDEVKKNKWKNVNIIIPVLSVYESYSPSKTLTELGQYASNRLNYFSDFNIIATDEYISNCIILKPIVLVSSEKMR